MGVLQVLLTTLYMFAPDTHISSTWQGIAIAAGSFIAALGGGAVASAGLGQRRS
jgi:hypothetical protein